MSRRTFAAFLLVPLIPAVALVHDAGPWIALVYSYVLTYVFGIPVFLVLRRAHKETHFRYILCGAISASSVMLAIYFMNYAHNESLLAIAGILGFIGAIEGYCFSAIRGKDRRLNAPNQSTDPTLTSGTAGAEHQSRHP
jgi:O-antigen/teichoic acid export membrane protein